MSNPFRIPTTSSAFDAADFDATAFEATEVERQPLTREISDAESEQLAMLIVAAADDRKGADISLLKVSDVSYLTDYFVIVTGFSTVQVRAIARSIQERAETEMGRVPEHMEGLDGGSWILLDYGDVIAHIFLPKEREFYNLEAFWGHAERVDLPVVRTRQDSIK